MKDKKIQIKHDGELHLWAIHRDVTAIVFNNDFSDEFKKQEIGNAIRAAYLLGTNTERRLDQQRHTENFHRSMEEITRSMEPQKSVTK